MPTEPCVWGQRCPREGRPVTDCSASGRTLVCVRSSPRAVLLLLLLLFRELLQSYTNQHIGRRGIVCLGCQYALFRPKCGGTDSSAWPLLASLWIFVCSYANRGQVNDGADKSTLSFLGFRPVPSSFGLCLCIESCVSFHSCWSVLSASPSSL